MSGYLFGCWVQISTSDTYDDKMTPIQYCAFLSLPSVFWDDNRIVFNRFFSFSSQKNISLTCTVASLGHLLIARKHTYESHCGNWNAKWHTCTFTHLPLCTYKKLRRMLSKDTVGVTPMHEHLPSFFPSFTAPFIPTAWTTLKGWFQFITTWVLFF